MFLNIYSKGKYPASCLSNFAPHAFCIDGVECASMEGFLQSLKFSDKEKQLEVCKMVGKQAKITGSLMQWRDVLYWQGNPVNRYSKEYQALLLKAFNELRKNKDFAKALIHSRGKVLIHTTGHWFNKRKTVLTSVEFCRILTHIRKELLKSI